MDKFVSLAQFARLSSRDRKTIYYQISKGNIVADKDKRIDITHPKNAAYLSMPRIRGIRPKPKPVVKVENAVDEHQYDFNSMTQADIAKLQKDIEHARKLKIGNDQKLKELVKRELVVKHFNNLASVIVNHMFPIGNRLAPKIAGVLKSTDASDILKIQSIIDSEISRALEQFKKECKLKR